MARSAFSTCACWRAAIGHAHRVLELARRGSSLDLRDDCAARSHRAEAGAARLQRVGGPPGSRRVIAGDGRPQLREKVRAVDDVRIDQLGHELLVTADGLAQLGEARRRRWVASGIGTSGRWRRGRAVRRGGQACRRHRQGGRQLRRPDGLADVVVHARGEARVTVAGHRIRGHGHDQCYRRPLRTAGCRAARMRRVASRPSSSGIWTSISTTS